MEGVAFPFTAWEQAVFVALFGVMIFVVLKWQSGQQKSWQEFMDSQNTKWQDAINIQNTQWQKWMDNQNNTQCASMERITKAIEALSKLLAEHDGKVEDRFSHAIDSLHEVTGPKKPRPTK